MANVDNLEGKREATQFRSGDEAVASGRKGGIASGAARRKKGNAKRLLSQMVASKPNLNSRERKSLIDAGRDPDAETLTNEDLMILALIKKAKSGDVGALKLYLEMFAEDPKTLIEEKRLKAQKEAFKAIKNSDGFMVAMTGVMEEVFEDGGDTPDALEDSE